MSPLMRVGSGVSCSKCGEFASTFSQRERMASRPTVWAPGGVGHDRVLFVKSGNAIGVAAVGTLDEQAGEVLWFLSLLSCGHRGPFVWPPKVESEPPVARSPTDYKNDY